MAEVRKFTFDTEFADDGDVLPQANPYQRLYSAQEVEQIKAKARSDGAAATMARVEAVSAQALASLAEAARFALPSLAAAGSLTTM